MNIKIQILTLIIFNLVINGCYDTNSDLNTITDNPIKYVIQKEKEIKHIWERGEKAYLILFDSVQVFAKIERDSVIINLKDYLSSNNDPNKSLVLCKIEENLAVLNQILFFMEKNGIYQLIHKVDSRIEFIFKNNSTLVWDGNEIFETTIFYSDDIRNFKYTIIKKHWIFIEEEKK